MLNDRAVDEEHIKQTTKEANENVKKKVVNRESSGNSR